MPKARLIEARWMRPHRGPRKVALRYADGSQRVVAHDGTLTVGEAAKLLKTYQLSIYRLGQRGKIAIENGDRSFARVSVASLAAMGSA
jgi:hypothetical protein